MSAREEIERYFRSSGPLSKAVEGFEDRPAQADMARLVMDALAEDGTLIVEAPTGTGKTLAYLLPALLYNRRVVVSTKTKNLQEQIFEKDWPFLRDKLGFAANVVVMKGRANYVCRSRLQRFNQQPRFHTREEASLYGKLMDWVLTTETGDRAEVEWMPEDFPAWNEISSNQYNCPASECLKHTDCFLQKMRRRAAAADILIVNHHLFFADLVVRESGHGEVIPDYHAVIFDEAHEIEDVATAFFATRFSSTRLDELDRDLVRAFSRGRAGQEEKIVSNLKGLRAAADHFFDGLRTGREEKTRLRPGDLNSKVLASLDGLGERLRAVSGLLASIGEGGDDSGEIRGLQERIEEILADAEHVTTFDDLEHVRYVETRGRGVHLVAEPIQPAQRIRDAVFTQANAVVFTSATLSTGKNFKFFRQRMGIDFPAREVVLPSCFDYAKQTVFYIPQDMPEPTDAAFMPAFVSEVGRILEATRGRAFVLFTSHRNMRQAYELLAGQIPYHTMLQGDGSRSALLRRFREDTHSVLFATASFWEGVDVVGEALSCVVIDKLPFASPGEPLVEARIEAINAGGGNAFFEYQVPQAIIALKQGLGRLIRHRNDRGLLVLTDSRMRRKSYGKRILDSLPAFPVTARLKDALDFAETLGGPGADWGVE